MKKKIALAALLSTLGAAGAAHAAPPLQLQAVRADQPIQVDGVEDKGWSKAVALKLSLDELPYKPSNGYAGMKRTDVELRALYDDEHVYFFVRYQDPTESLQRFPWVKQPDGSWKQMANPDSTGHENTWYEDKLGFYWNISQKGFEKKGCDMSCHVADNGMVEGVKDSSAGRHYTKEKGETLDLWHWKSTRTGPVGQADDQYIDASRQESKGWGRQTDEGAGGYYENKRADGKGPAWMNGPGVAAQRHLTIEDGKVAFADNFKPGALINGVVAKALTGSRGDLAVRGVWKDGYWTLELKRKRVTQGARVAEQDVQFADLAKTYHFGLAVFDGSQINHLFHKKSIALNFKQ